jgi:hypothetical protein
MGRVAAYRYATPSWEIAAIVLATLGIDDLRRDAVPKWYLICSLIGADAIAVGIFSTGDPLRTVLALAPHIHTWILVSVAWGLGMLILVGAAILLLRGRARTGVLLVCLVLDVTVMFVVPELSAPRQATIATGSIKYLDRHLGNQRFYTLLPIATNYGSYFRLQTVNINDAPSPKAYDQFITHSLDTNVNPAFFTGTTTLNPKGNSPLQEFVTHISAYEKIGVSYLVVKPGQVPTAVARPAHLQLVFISSNVDIYRLPTSVPMFSVKSGNCQLSRQTVSSVHVDCKTPAVMVRHELFMPGWSAATRGVPLGVQSATGVFQEVGLAPGSATVTFTFIPRHEHLAGLCLLGGIVLLVLGWRRGGRRRLGRRRPGSTRLVSQHTTSTTGGPADLDRPAF